MILFLLVYVSIYGGVHVYAFMKLKRGLELGIAENLLLALLMLLMVAAPIVVRMLEHNGQGALARGLAYVSFIWMALLFIFIFHWQKQQKTLKSHQRKIRFMAQDAFWWWTMSL